MPDSVEELLARGRGLAGHGEPAAAAVLFRSALALNPNYAEVHGCLGKALRLLGRTEESQASLTTAIQLAPHYAEAHMALAAIHAERQEWEQAAERCLAAVELLPDSPAVYRHLVQTLAHASFRTAPPRLADELARGFRTGNIDFQDLIEPSASILSLDALYISIESWFQKPKGRLPASKLAALAENCLFAEMLTAAYVTEPRLEQLLTQVRRALLRLPNSRGLLSLGYLLAVQGANNAFAWFVTPEEEQALDALQPGLDGAAEWDLVRFAMYRPLGNLPAELVEEIARDRWNDPLRSPLKLRLLEQLEEREILRRLKPPAGHALDAVTQRVKAHYEEYPFPRWRSTTPLEPHTVADYVRRQAPGFDPPLVYERPVKILIAGCGTGKQAVDAALRHPDSSITAIDLSGPSVAYAMRMAAKYRTANLEIRQCNILDVRGLGEVYDLIECSGVLHHMPDPLAGWAALLDVLRPQGIMNAGLYSAIGRAENAAFREQVAARGLRPTPQGIRQFRRELIERHEKGERFGVMRDPVFFTMGGARDLIFHECELPFTIPAIAGFLRKHRLRFLGFVHRDARTEAEFRAEHPESTAWTDLEKWHEFELRHPGTFPETYYFYCMKS